MPDDQFLRDAFKLHMPLEGGFDLVFEVMSVDGTVITRELVREITATMVQYSLRGFAGTFNAVLRQGTGQLPICVALRLNGFVEMQAITPTST